MSKWYVGIDLGTTNSALSTCRVDDTGDLNATAVKLKRKARSTSSNNEHEEETLPSCVQYKKDVDGNYNIIVGDYAKEQADELTDILKKISGVGDVYVLLTVSAAEKTVYQTNYDESTGSDSGSVRHDTVIIVDSERNEQGLIQQIIAPQYRGAVIVCNGADDPQVKLSVMEAVKNATGLGYDRISVLKM